MKPRRRAGPPLNSAVVKRSIKIDGRKSSVSLEDAFWDALKEIAETQKVHVSELVSTIESERQQINLSSAIRLFVFDQYRRQLGARRGRR
jgi:predicted DNA-binding ribbon-helix-helix protein